jgi:cytochrome c-type biogenesis protein CcmE
MTRKQHRAVLIFGGVGVLCVAVLLLLFAVRDSVVFFHTPTEVATKHIPPGQRIRLGGLVAKGSFKRGSEEQVEFAITDTQRTIPVDYHGILPDLFREGQGVVAEGKLDGAGRFVADTVLAKHDETYMPPEVAKALKEHGLWQGAAAAAPQPGRKP